MIDLDFEITSSGPLFDGRLETKLNQGQRQGIVEIVDRGWGLLNEMLTMKPRGVYLSVQEAEPGKASRGYYRGHLSAQIRDSSFGFISDSGVVYGPWLEGTGSANTTTRFKGYSSFRKTAQRLRSEATQIMQRALRGALRV